jgi:hypothetical protein
VAPELIDGTADQAVDMDSFAMIFWELITGKSIMTGYPGGEKIDELEL